jgi:hypothetical protein
MHGLLADSDRDEMDESEYNDSPSHHSGTPRERPHPAVTSRYRVKDDRPSKPTMPLSVFVGTVASSMSPYLYRLAPMMIPPPRCSGKYHLERTQSRMRTDHLQPTLSGPSPRVI